MIFYNFRDRQFSVSLNFSALDFEIWIFFRLCGEGDLFVSKVIGAWCIYRLLWWPVVRMEVAVFKIRL